MNGKVKKYLALLIVFAMFLSANVTVFAQAIDESMQGEQGELPSDVKPTTDETLSETDVTNPNEGGGDSDELGEDEAAKAAEKVVAKAKAEAEKAAEAAAKKVEEEEAKRAKEEAAKTAQEEIVNSITFEFYIQNSDKADYNQVVFDGGTLTEPFAPKTLENQRFIGWFEDGKNPTYAFNEVLEIKETKVVKLFATFEDIQLWETKLSKKTRRN